MGRLLTLLGVLLVFIDIPFFLLSITGLESEWFAALIQPLVCRGEEAFHYAESSSGAMQMTCEVGEKSREVTGMVMIGLVGTFFGSFILGFILMVIGKNITIKQEAQNNAPLVDSFTLRKDMEIIEIEEAVELGMLSQGAAVSMQKVLDALDYDMGEFLYEPLDQQLQHLADAEQQGLLSSAEHERLRTAIINHFSE